MLDVLLPLTFLCLHRNISEQQTYTY